MTIVNFSAEDVLIKKIDEIIDHAGFSSRAEFFRHLAMNYVDEYSRRMHEEKRFKDLNLKFEKLINKKLTNKKHWLSLKEQLNDL